MTNVLVVFAVVFGGVLVVSVVAACLLSRDGEFFDACFPPDEQRVDDELAAMLNRGEP